MAEGLQYTGQQAQGAVYSGTALGGRAIGQFSGEPVVSNALDQHEKMLAALVEELSSLCGRAGSLADRMFGPSPEAVGANEKGPANPPQVRRIEDLAGAAHMRVAALRGYLERLERL